MGEGCRGTEELAVTLIETLTQVLMGTQCTECGFPTCAAYAGALAAGESTPNRCRPGGEAVLRELQRVLGQEADFNMEILAEPRPVSVAVVDEAACIGCTLCRQACPTDAFVGIAKTIHTVIEGDCTGCGLCEPVCPVNCIAFTVPRKRALVTESGAEVGRIRAATWRLVDEKRVRSARGGRRGRPVVGGVQQAMGVRYDLTAPTPDGLQDKITAARAQARARHGHLAGVKR